MIRYRKDSIKELRESLGLTMSQFADKLGISRQHVYILERGAHNPTTKTLENIMNVFNLDPGYFFELNHACVHN